MSTTRTPFLTTGMADDVVPELAQLLTDLGHYSGPVGSRELTPELMAAVNAYRTAADITDSELPAGANPNETIGTETWAALTDARDHADADGPEPGPGASQTPTPADYGAAVAAANGAPAAGDALDRVEAAVGDAVIAAQELRVTIELAAIAVADLRGRLA